MSVAASGRMASSQAVTSRCRMLSATSGVPTTNSASASMLHDVERQLEALAALVVATPEVADSIRQRDVTASELAMRPEAATLMTGLDAFLAAHGHLGQGFDDLAMPSWAEDPDLLLTELAKRVEHPPTVGAGERRERQAAEAEVLAAGVRARLADDPARLDRFEALLGFARLIGPLTEVHNYWIDRMAQSSLRRFVMRVAGRLVAADVIDRPDDVFYLRRDEIPELLRRPADRRQVVVARRAEQAHWAAIQPPRKIGRHRRMASTTASTASGSSPPSRTSCAAPEPPPGSFADAPG